MTLQLHFPKESDNLYPIFSVPVSAGQAQEIEQTADWISLDEFVRSSIESTYYITVTGNSMVDIGIYHGDLLVVERREWAEKGDIVIAEINGEFTVKEFQRQPAGLYLVPANVNLLPQKIRHKDYFKVWGVVTHVLHKLKKG